jgi:hypothetical protein
VNYLLRASPWKTVSIGQSSSLMHTVYVLINWLVHIPLALRFSYLFSSYLSVYCLVDLIGSKLVSSPRAVLGEQCKTVIHPSFPVRENSW